MKYENIYVKQYLDFVCGYDGGADLFGYDDPFLLTKVDMIDFIKEKTENFDPVRFKYFIEDVRNYPVHFYRFEDEGYASSIDYSEFEPDKWVNNLYYECGNSNTSIIERIYRAEDEYPSVYCHYNMALHTFSDLVESEYKRVTESNTETEPTLIGIKRPNNTHNIQFALLERLGIIDYLKREYNLPDIKMSELIANIINKDIQNTRTMLMFTKTKKKESNLPKNQERLNDILIKTGIIQKD